MTLSPPTFPTLEPLPAVESRPVFVDGTGRRRRLLRWAAVGIAGTCSAYLAVLGVAVGAGSVDPVTSGLPLSGVVAPLVGQDPPTSSASVPTTASPTSRTATRATAVPTGAPVAAVPVASVPATAAPVPSAAPAATGAAPTSAAPTSSAPASTSDEAATSVPDTTSADAPDPSVPPAAGVDGAE